MRRWPVILLLLSLSACGGGEDAEPGVATLEGEDPAAASSTTEARLEPEVALLEFSQCMRDNGIALPDVAVPLDRIDFQLGRRVDRRAGTGDAADRYACGRTQ